VITPLSAVNSFYETDSLLQLDAGCAGKLLLDWKSEGPNSQIPWSDQGTQTSHKPLGKLGANLKIIRSTLTIIFA
jgi:hypothetical protein